VVGERLDGGRLRRLPSAVAGEVLAQIEEHVERQPVSR
jgi:hypothetical protein